MSTERSISLIFEVSQGCQLSCGGCTMDTAATGMPTRETWARLHKLFDEFEAEGIPFAEFELGPTDLITATNRREIFTSSDVWRLAHRFRLITLAAAFIHPNPTTYESLALEVHSIAPTSTVGVTMPVELPSIFNDKYLATMRRNLDAFQNRLHQPMGEVILAVIFDTQYLSEKLRGRHTYEELFERIQSLQIGYDTKVDFTFQHGRRGLTDPIVAREFLDSFRELNRQYLLDLGRRATAIQPRHVPFQLVLEPKGGELLYNQGELYIRPVLNERLAVISNRTRFGHDWTLYGYRHEVAQRLNRNLEAGMRMKDCQTCPQLGTCAARGIQDIMQLTHTQRCITMLRDYRPILEVPRDNLQDTLQWSPHVG